jgi:hypothetical protein
VSRPFAALVALACACGLALPAGALALDPASEVPDVTGSKAQAVASGVPSTAATPGPPAVWATVNICDTQATPNSMGVRASMPGNQSSQRMFMRFSAEYWSRARQSWTPVAGDGRSQWVYAGRARLGRRQAGWTFAFGAPPAGVTYTMRAHVEFEWRARQPRRGARDGSELKSLDLRQSRASRLKVVRSVTQTTVTGISAVRGGDPAGTSKAMCLIY